MTATTALIVRPATEADIPAITRIYNQGIVDRLATLETEERTEEERRAYRYVADFSVYVAREARGMGVGSGLRLYQRHGFREVGVYKEQGVLDGRWVDTIVMELLLDDELPPAE